MSYNDEYEGFKTYGDLGPKDYKGRLRFADRVSRRWA